MTITSKPVTDAYAQGWEAVWGRKEPEPEEPTPPRMGCTCGLAMTCGWCQEVMGRDHAPPQEAEALERACLVCGESVKDGDSLCERCQTGEAPNEL